MKLPDKFQFRSTTNLGFTHTCKKNAVGDYEVEWAKGWLKLNNNVDPWIVATEGDVGGFVGNGDWVVVDDTPKVEWESKLPDEFFVRVSKGKGEMYVFRKLREGEWMCNQVPATHNRSPWSGRDIKALLEKGYWVICEAPNVLTPEQQARNQEFRERIEQLERGIKIKQKVVEHHQALIDSYRNTIEDLKAKIVEGV